MDRLVTTVGYKALLFICSTLNIDSLDSELESEEDETIPEASVCTDITYLTLCMLCHSICLCNTYLTLQIATNITKAHSNTTVRCPCVTFVVCNVSHFIPLSVAMTLL